MAGPVLAGGGAQALDAAYGGLSDLIVSLDEDQSWKSTRCRGWVVRDLILHLLSDAQRGLVALARPGHQPPDKDAVTLVHRGMGTGRYRTRRPDGSAPSRSRC